MSEIPSAAQRHFSVGVILNVWKGDNLGHVRTSLHSILNQTWRPDEILVVADGQLPDDLESLFVEQQEHVRFLTAGDLPRGLAVARNFGIQHLTSDYVMIQDADDISHPQRLQTFQRLLSASEIAPDLVSASMLEFDSENSAVCGLRDAPNVQQSIAEQLRRRNTINHPTVFIRRSSFVKNGSYQTLNKLEDYLTWATLSGNPEFIFGVIDVPLVAFRVTPQYLQRRGGMKLLQSELRLQKVLKSVLPRKPSLMTKICRLIYTAVPPLVRQRLSKRLLSKSDNVKWDDIQQFVSDTLAGEAKLLLVPPPTK